MRRSKIIPKWMLKIGNDTIDFSDSGVVYINKKPTSIIITSNNTMKDVLGKIAKYKREKAVESITSIIDNSDASGLSYNLTKIKNYLMSNG